MGYFVIKLDVTGEEITLTSWAFSDKYGKLNITIYEYDKFGSICAPKIDPCVSIVVSKHLFASKYTK